MTPTAIWGALIGAQILSLLLAWALLRATTRPDVDGEALMRMICAGRLSGDAICVVDAEGRIVATNAPYAGLTGYTPGELQNTLLCTLLRDSLDDPATLDVVSMKQEHHARGREHPEEHR